MKPFTRPAPGRKIYPKIVAVCVLAAIIFCQPACKFVDTLLFHHHAPVWLLIFVVIAPVVLGLALLRWIFLRYRR